MSLTAKKQRSYRSKKGNVTFVYAVTGSAEELAKYKQSQGDYYREDDKGVALWFSTKFIGERGELIITEKGTVTPDMSRFDAAASIASQYGGNLGQELAKQAAADLLGKPMEQAPAPVAPVAEESNGPKIGDI